MDTFTILENSETEYNQLNKLYDECLNYLKAVKTAYTETFVTKIHEVNGEIKINSKNLVRDDDNSDYDDIEIPNRQNGEPTPEIEDEISEPITFEAKITDFKLENEIESKEDSVKDENGIPDVVSEEIKSERLRKLSLQLPKIIITQSNTASNASMNIHKEELVGLRKVNSPRADNRKYISASSNASIRYRPGYGDYPKRLISKNGMENVALISNIPYERIRMLNDTFHTLINVRWRWIVWGTICVHFAIWLVFAVFWYITAMAHYDFEPDPPKKTCVTGGNDFLTIFLASVEAQTTIGFGDRTIDEECPESIFLFIMQLILGTGLSGVLTCVVYAKLTRPEKLSRDGVGFSKKAVISMRDGKLCLMIRTWDLNHDHIIGSEFNAHFVKTHRTKEGEVIRHYARSLELQQRQFLLWPVTLVHVIDETSPLFHMTPQDFANFSYEITLSLKGASASMGTFTQSQTSYLPKEIVWGYRFPPVVKYDRHKQKYAIEHKKLDLLEPVEMPMCSASQLYSVDDKSIPGRSSQSSFNERISGFHLQRSSSFRKNEIKS